MSWRSWIVFVLSVNKWKWNIDGLIRIHVFRSSWRCCLICVTRNCKLDCAGVSSVCWWNLNELSLELVFLLSSESEWATIFKWKPSSESEIYLQQSSFRPDVINFLSPWMRKTSQDASSQLDSTRFACKFRFLLDSASIPPPEIRCIYLHNKMTRAHHASIDII